MEQKLNTKVMLLISTIIAILVLTIGFAFAYFGATGSTSAQRITSGELSINFESTNILRATRLIPITEDQVETTASEINFTVKNNGSLNGYFDIYLTEVDISDELKDAYFKWRLYEGDSIIAEGNFLDIGTEKLLKGNIGLTKSQTKSYKILVWLEESNTNQNHMQDKKLKAKVTVESKDRSNTLADNTIDNLIIYGNSIQNGTPNTSTPVEIQSVGDLITDESDAYHGKYNIPITVTGKNLLDVSKTENGTIAVSGGTNYSTAERVRINYKYLTAGTYTISTPIEIKTGNYLHKYSKADATTWLGSLTFEEVTSDNKSVRTFTLDQDCYVRFVFMPNTVSTLNIDTITQYDIQLEQGSNATDYEPYEQQTYNIYLDEPLRSVANHKDYIDFSKGEIVRNIYSEKITEVTTKSTNTGAYSVFLTDITKTPLLSGSSVSAIGYALSNKFEYSELTYNDLKQHPNKIQSYITTTGISRMAYTFGDASINTVELAQSAIGDGFTAQYVIAEPDIQQISLPQIKKLAGTTILSVDTTVKPTIEGEY